MTIENKVALVVGFALVLFVGILVSDHLSKAQTQRAADLLPAVDDHRPAVRRPARFVDLQTTDRPRPGPPAKPPPPQLAAPIKPPAAGVYTVRPGDSLSEIALRIMGSAGRWRQLYELNRDAIANPDAIRVGTVLKVPTG